MRAILPMKVEHARNIAALHIQGISTGFISSLGIDFVTALYEAIAKSTSSFGLEVEDNGKVLGFVTFTTNLNKLYKSIIAKKGWRFGLLLAGKIFSLQRIKKLFETLLYPTRVKEMNLSSAELLSIVIHPGECRGGLATKLVQKSFEHCQKIGLDKVKVLVGADNEPANKLYIKCGFKLVGQIDNHGVTSNIYEAQIDKALSEKINSNKASKHCPAPNLVEKTHLLTPMPEPAAIALLEMATAATLIRKRRSAKKRRSA